MLTEDLDTFFEVDEFGVTVTLAGTEVTGIFGEQPIEVDFVQTVTPAFMYKSAAVSGVVYDSTLVNGSDTYKVKRIKQDETGRITTLGLELQ